jgi:hypothetical protein
VDGPAFPRVLFVTTHPQRGPPLQAIIAKQPAERWQLFAVTTLGQMLDVVADRASALAQQLCTDGLWAALPRRGVA